MGDYVKNKAKTTFFLKIIFSTLTFALIMFIFYNSIQDSEKSSESSGRIMDFLNVICNALGLKFTFTQPIVRTLAHFCEFGLLGVLSLFTTLCYFGVKARSLIVSISTVFVTAITDEIIQLFSDGRAFQISDIIIDVSGGFLGLVIVFLFALLIKNHRIKV